MPPRPAADSRCVPLPLLDLIRRATGRELTSYSRAALVTASHEIEDRAMTGGSAAMLFGGFQRARFYRHDRERWRALAARSAIAVAAYGGEGDAPAGGEPFIVRVGPGDPFWTDWLCLSYAGSDGSAVVVARDARSDPDRPGERRCVGLLTYDPRVVHVAALWVGEYLRRHDPPLAARWRSTLAGMPPLARHHRHPTALSSRSAPVVGALRRPG